MRDNNWIFVLSMMLLLLVSCSRSKVLEIYVSPDGNDHAGGRAADPVLSVHRAAELARRQTGKNPVVIWLAGGVYRITEPLELGVEDGGTSDAQVIWKAMPGDRPVISGGRLITDWQKEANGNWSAAIPEEVDHRFRSLYINDRMAVRARYPDTSFLKVYRVGEDNRTNFFFQAQDLPKIEDNQNLELVFLHDWSISRVGVQSIDFEKRQLFAADTIGATSLPFFTLNNWEEHPRYFLENALEFLDQPGEWYADFRVRRIYYRPLPEENIEELEAVVPLAPQLLTIKGDKRRRTFTGNITFEGIIFEHTSWLLPQGGYCGIQACMFDNRRNIEEGWDKVPAAIELDLAENCTFKHCQIRHTGGSGIWIRQDCRSCSIENSHVYDISGNGISIGEGQDRLVNGLPWWQAAPEQVCAGTRLSKCLIEDCGRQFYGAVGIWAGLVAKTLIDHNEVRNLPYTGVSVGWMWDTIPTPCRENTIIGNHIHHIMNILSDGGGIYNLGLQPGSRIASNLIHNVSINAGRAESNGMFLDEGIKDVIVENNIIYNIARSPLRFHRASTNIVRNNVLVCGVDVPPIRYNRTREEDILKINNQLLNSSLPTDMDQLQAILNERKGAFGPGSSLEK